jgi:hypothetical protein
MTDASKDEGVENRVPCRLCDKPTGNAIVSACDGCWEFDKHLDATIADVTDKYLEDLRRYVVWEQDRRSRTVGL